MQNIGYLTDCIFHKLNGIIEKKEDYILIKTPSNPTYYWGNLLHFQQAPKRGSFARWMDYFKKEFGKNCIHVTFAWDEEAKGEIKDFLAAGFDWNEQIVLHLDEPQLDFELNKDVDVRPISTEEDWRAVIDLQIQMNDQEKTPGFIEFKEKAFATIRNNQEQGYGSWWGAFLNGKLVGDMGLFFDDDNGIGRFQIVETRPDFQNRRICKTLLKSVITHAIEVRGISTLVIVTESNNHARHVYRSCGFADHSKQCGVCLAKRYWKEHD
ncbi:MAG: GNAT family N-acetyltransferase [Opitutales bacterium]|nr:GNAT family N-acetyltransferase [Opitutales bacterium]